MVALFIVTMLSMLLAAVMSAVAWRVIREERRRSDARVEALSAEIRREDRRGEDLDARSAKGLSSAWFSAAERSSARGRFAVIMALGVVVVGSAAALAVLLSAGSRTTAPHAAVAPVAASDPNVELVALSHERSGDHLTIHGVVHNPHGGVRVNQLSAVVFVFNHEGAFVASARALIERSALAPGEESPFVVTVPGVADVGRYRVSFRSDERVVPHIDRRARSAAQSLS